MVEKTQAGSGLAKPAVLRHASYCDVLKCTFMVMAMIAMARLATTMPDVDI